MMAFINFIVWLTAFVCMIYIVRILFYDNKDLF